MTEIIQFPVTKFGIDIDDNPSYETFASYVEAATDVSNGACWALGDLYELSRQREEFAQAFNGHKKSLKTLQNYATVVRSFPKSRRVYDVSFSHYREVISLKDEQGRPLEYVQDELLRQAAKDQLNRDDFRDIVRQAKGSHKEHKTIEAKVGLIDDLLQKDYGLELGETVKVTISYEVEDEKQEQASA